jgi:hypothetical protein
VREDAVKRLMVTILAAALAVLYGQNPPVASSLRPSGATVSTALQK